jgi:hypothetical protein
MHNDHSISFGDNVRIRSTALTQELGLANLVGNVHGETTPSVTSVEVIGEIKEDYAVHVLFEERDEGFWFAPELLEFINHAAGTEIRLEGVPKKWVRSETGEWVESEAEGAEQTKNPWWKFW